VLRSPHARQLAAAAFACALAGCIIHDQGASKPPAGVTAAAPPPSEWKPLRGAATEGHRLVGTALMSAQISDPRARAVVAREFNSLTPENEMKWEAVEPRPGEFAFAAGDKLVAFAAANGMRMRGHTLVWHNQLPYWAKQLPPEQLRAAMTRHINGVVGHWKGQVKAWDVVNEALAQGDTGALRADSPFAALGPTFIDEAFRLAHAADPDAQLFYNDYEIEGDATPKSDAAFQLCKRLVEAGVPIHGIGMQMHVDPRSWPSADSIRRNMQRFAALGLAVEITEMDVPVGEIAGTREEKLKQQRVIAHDIVAACVAVERCAAITFWGLTDRNSWLATEEWGHIRGRLPHYPLLFDADYRPKPVIGGVLDALAGR
jgi:endo-1,4-beta-xylanase